jgi:probable FeS assembly SUF system protein SufT
MSTGIDSLQASDEVQFGRDCEATQIPSGVRIVVPKGTPAYVGQTLGGNVTLQISTLGLVQITGRNLDALLKDGVPVAQAAAGSSADEDKHQGPADEKALWEAMKQCYDPEIPCNVVDLGLIYDVKRTDLPSTRSRVDVKMTLTAMGCGMGPAISAQVRDRLLEVPGVEEATVDIVWDPPWNQSMITDDGKKRLGLW